MNVIQTATIPAAQSLTHKVPCHIWGDLPPITPGMQFIEFIHTISETSTKQIHPISLILRSNGTIQAEPVKMELAGDYPAVYLSPSSQIYGLSP